ncbi:alginate lyase family protein [Aquimarina sp. 2201CG1-2-11]|uniref:heparinase II/III domain-containing protein n=1 Tax=Aquimarina discodermiae TaxID=3231043 RepID=UPI00346310EC
MDSGKLTLVLRTVKHLKIKQLYYQVYYLIRNKFFKKEYHKLLSKDISPLRWEDTISYQNSYSKTNRFSFLNITHQFEDKIDWNYPKYGKLWAYNLNYFDFLHQEHISVDEGLALIENYVLNDAVLRDGKEPYPISLRGINWIKFLSRNTITDSNINQALYNHYETLLHNLEYHLLGNHLLENGYSLLFGAYYFKDDRIYKRAKHILQRELKEQIVYDGGHFELSPMYHQILLHRLLDCINLVESNSWKNDDLHLFMKEKAQKMLSWLQQITYQNGNIPMVNDSAYNIALSSQELFEYASFLKIEYPKSILSDSGYRMFSNKAFELFTDVGQVGPSYQPGHAHSDTFNFELYVKQQPIIVDVGTSTYEKNELRLQERQTASHNTVKIGNIEQTEVWDGFRVARRAKVISLEESDNHLEATHNGYKTQGVLHTRSFSVEDARITIHDVISKVIEKEQVAFFHFHPDVKDIQISNTSVYLPNQNVGINFEKGILKIEEENYNYAIGFNKRERAKKLAVYFKKALITTINV